MASQQQIVVASSFRPLLDMIRRAAAATGEPLGVKESSPEVVLADAAKATPTLVILHARGNGSEWLDLFTALHKTHPTVPLLVIGDTADVGVIARGIANGLRNYVTFADAGMPSAVARVLTDAIEGRDAASDGVYGRVKAMLPQGPFDSGNYRNGLGKTYSREAAIQQCIALGLTAEEAARLLKVPETEAAKAVRRGLRKLHAPVFQLPATRTLATFAAVVGSVMCLFVLASRPRRAAPLPYELASVSGYVSLDGKPLQGGVVRLAPDASQGTRGPHGVAIVDAEGRFAVKTAGHDGAVVGNHRIAVLQLDVQPPSSREESQKLPPSKYGREASSGLTCVISRNTENRLTLTLSSAESPNTSTPSPKE